LGGDTLHHRRSLVEASWRALALATSPVGRSATPARTIPIPHPCGWPTPRSLQSGLSPYGSGRWSRRLSPGRQPRLLPERLGAALLLVDRTRLRRNSPS